MALVGIDDWKQGILCPVDYVRSLKEFEKSAVSLRMWHKYGSMASNTALYNANIKRPYRKTRK